MKNLKLELGKIKSSFLLLKPDGKFVKKHSERDDFNLSVYESLEKISELENTNDENVLLTEIKNLRAKLDELFRVRMK